MAARQVLERPARSSHAKAAMLAWQSESMGPMRPLAVAVLGAFVFYVWQCFDGACSPRPPWNGDRGAMAPSLAVEAAAAQPARQGWLAQAC